MSEWKDVVCVVLNGVCPEDKICQMFKRFFELYMNKFSR
jgi:hypothetical protein